MYTVHFAYISSLPTAEKAAAIVTFTPAELAAYAAYLDAIAFDYVDDVPADYVAPTAASVLAEAQATLAVDAAEAFDAEYDAYLDSLPPSQPLPADLGEDDDDPDPEPPPAAPSASRSASHVYLLHFTAPVGHARHYLGSTNDVARRLAEHRDPNDPNGARLPHVAVIRGAELVLARTWRGGRFKERIIKEAYKHAFTSLCPLCHAGAGSLPKRATVTKYAA